MKDTRVITQKLLDYCHRNDWSGYDPYDALNSRIFKFLPFLNFRIPRLVLTQVLKRSPVNVRPLLMIPKTHNPKAIALFLMALVRLSRLGFLNTEILPAKMVDKLAELRSPGLSYWCWGYSFPWQTRTLLVARGTPNLVCTVFVANALLDVYESNGERRCLDMAVSSAEYILNELFWSEDEGATAGFSYPLPSLNMPVHNANFLGAALLCRVYQHVGDRKFLDAAMKVARYSAAKQHDDGSWDYGESSMQHWVDNFHTGYNLCALRAIEKYADNTEFDCHISKGFAFYRNHFFEGDGAPKYFHNRTYPIDIHSVAQSIITLLTFKDLDEQNVNLAFTIFRWALTHMWDERGYFYYQVFPLGTNRIAYMRWAQAWMLVALASLLGEPDQEQLAHIHISSDS
ncbi:hypothetical protein V2P20_02605 [Methylobacter sp. Wu1]|uniref:hypothetical protein n=1 Tax=Methylobacter sp. Wu1 TaxID=3119359 RepID=UPI002F9563B9